MNERPVKFDCNGVPLIGIHHPASQPARRGILMAVAGGPQYRVGGHRQLVLWARRLAAEGYPVFRYDHRGWGDSYGDFHDFDAVDDDLRAAMDAFTAAEPGLEEVVLWGECNAAAAILFYAYRDPRVRGLALQNPWARSEQGQAKTMLRHYYLMRLKQPEFWQKLLKLRFNPLDSARSLSKILAGSLRGAKPEGASSSSPADPAAPLPSDLSLPDRLYAGFSRFKGPVLLTLSSRDLIAREFDEAVRANPKWAKLMSGGACRRHEMPDGDHTFSSAEQRNRVVSTAISWLGSW